MLRSLMVILFLGITISLQAAELPEDIARQAIPITIENSRPIADFDKGQLQISTTHLQNVSFEQVSRIIHSTHQNQPHMNMVISTDSPDLVAEVENHTREKQNKLYVVFDKVKQYKDFVIRSAREDKFGVIVMVINTGYDISIWCHAETVSTSYATAQIIMNLIFAGTFHLNKDLWTNMTRPLEGRIHKFLNYLNSRALNTDSGAGTALMSKFFANLAFSTAFQTMRVSLMSLDHLSAAFQSAHFWGTSLALGAMLTASSFSWSEQLANIDKIKNPIAKNTFRRISEIRNLITGHFAANGKLLQPDVYGYGPWLVSIAHGSLGLLSLFKSDYLIEKIEKSPTLIKFNELYERIDRYLERFFPAKYCRQTFT